MGVRVHELYIQIFVFLVNLKTDYRRACKQQSFMAKFKLHANELSAGAVVYV